jgi:DNA-binding XRE family transcriptional regulator
VFGRGLPIRAHNNGEEGGAESHSCPHNSGGAVRPRFSNSSDIGRNRTAGNLLVTRRQLETAFSLRLNSALVALLPPKASMTAGTVWSRTMPGRYSTPDGKSRGSHVSKNYGLRGNGEPAYNDAIMALEPTGTQEAAERLRNSRLALKLTQTRICEIVGIERSTWNNAELGLSRLSVDNMILVCQKTGMTLDWFYRGIKSGLPFAIAEALDRVEQSPPPRRRHK